MDKRFNFRLERVLRLKSQRVVEMQESLNKALLLREDKERQIEEQANYLNSLNHSRNGISTVSNLQTDWSHKSFVADEIKRLRSEREQLLEIEELRRKKLSEAMKEEKMLEKLKEKQHIAYKDEQQKEETKVLDEIAGRVANKDRILKI